MAIIHLLDDDIAVTQACAFLLESLGYEVSCWEQGEKFLAEANLHQVGVLLLDMRMPVLDGHAVHEIMRQKQVRWRWSFSPGTAMCRWRSAL